MSSSHRRYNPLIDQWVLCSPGRLSRPWRGAREAPSETPAPEHDPDCYMCPRNARASGEKNPDYRGVFLFDNDYPAFAAESGNGQSSHPLFRAAPVRGRCRVLCFSDKHNLHFGSMSEEGIRRVVDAWASETERLSLEEGTAYVQIFENRGAMMGASNPHPHGQIWATGSVPTIPERMAARLSGYFESMRRDLLGDYLEEELRREERLVHASRHWVQIVPFWAVWPFETMVVPRRPAGSLSDLSDDERSDLARLLKALVSRYDALFAAPFPYSMGWYQRPVGGTRQDGFRLHASYLPPLLRSASIRKFLVGYELTAEPQRDFLPEQAAARLRAALA
jgi:UDPglucose--hexose-1-phosphate uridylyltransferase